MTNELKDKLKLALRKDLNDECQVVYILSRIRKIIELENTRNRYKLLNIYCNWSLHAKIDKTEDIKDVLEEFVNKAESRHKLLLLNNFKDPFKGFIKDVLSIDLPVEYIDKFVRILTNVISDTPISIRKSKVVTITINPSELPRKENEITYKITEHDE